MCRSVATITACAGSPRIPSPGKGPKGGPIAALSHRPGILLLFYTSAVRLLRRLCLRANRPDCCFYVWPHRHRRKHQPFLRMMGAIQLILITPGKKREVISRRLLPRPSCTYIISHTQSRKVFSVTSTREIRPISPAWDHGESGGR